MRTRTCTAMEREGMRVVAHGEKRCRSQPMGKKGAPIAAQNEPSVFEKRFWLFAGGVVLLWGESGDTILISPAALAYGRGGPVA
jgi:hypothetical protein